MSARHSLAGALADAEREPVHPFDALPHSIRTELFRRAVVRFMPPFVPATWPAWSELSPLEQSELRHAIADFRFLGEMCDEVSSL